jgi:molybdate transport system permease protein
MDWTALKVSLWLALATAAVLLPLGVYCARLIVFGDFRGKALLEAGLTLPLVLPPTVLGYYLRAFEAIAPEVREAAACCGISPWRTLWRIELPLAWPGIISGMIMTIAHTMGEFGVVLMIGGSIPGTTRTVAISIYDSVQAFDMRAAGTMSAALLAFALATLAFTNWLARKRLQARA